MKYLLKSVDTKVKAIIALNDTQETPSGYITLTQPEYDLGLAAQKKDKLILWDSTARTFSTDQTTIDAALASGLKQIQLDELRALSSDIDLYTRLSESAKVSALQEDFDALKTAYQS
jgi:hypothetical protein